MAVGTGTTKCSLTQSNQSIWELPHLWKGRNSGKKRPRKKNVFRHTRRKQAHDNNFYLVCVNIWGHSLVKEIRAHSSCLEVVVKSCRILICCLKQKREIKDYLSLNMQLERQGLFCEQSGIITSCVTKQIQTTDLRVTLSQGKNEKNWFYYFNHFKEALYKLFPSKTDQAKFYLIFLVKLTST